MKAQKPEEPQNYTKVFIRDKSDLPENILIHVGSRNGFEELLYIENGKTMKPWKYDKNDTPILSIENIIWYLKPEEPAKGLTDGEIEKEAILIIKGKYPYYHDDNKEYYIRLLIKFAKWARSRMQGNLREELIKYSRWSEKYWNIITNHKEKVDKYLSSKK